MQIENKLPQNFLKEELENQYGFKHLSEDEKLLLDANRSGIEKLHLFTRMLKRNNTLNKYKNQTIINNK
jgi:hypothetical protein